MYHLVKNTISLFLKPVYPIKVIGAENIPKDGGVLICSNHVSNLDPPVLGISCPRPIHFMAKEELFHVPIIKDVIGKCNAFPVKRGMGDREALRRGLKVLKDGNVFGLFPEGTRSKTGELTKAFSGAGFFALRSEAQVIPCAIIGPYKIWRPLKVVYGEPVDIQSLREKKASAEETTNAIMEEIRKLINQHS